MVSEDVYYEDICDTIESIFRHSAKKHGYEEEIDVHLEVTAEGSIFLKELNTIEIQESFSRQRPDVTGYESYRRGAINIIIAEIKAQKLRLQDLYQMLRYADLFDANYSFLVTTDTIPTSIENFFEQRIVPVEDELGIWMNRGIILCEYSPRRDCFTKYMASKAVGPVHITDSIEDRIKEIEL